MVLSRSAGCGFVSMVLCAVLGLSGCGSAERTGQAVPAASSAPVASSDGSAVFDGTAACELLDVVGSPLGFPPGRVSNTGSDNGCQTSKSGVALSLDLDSRQSYDDLRGDPNLIFDGTVNQRPAKLRHDKTKGLVGCSVSLRVATMARAIVGIGTGVNGTSEQACEQAKQAAEGIEPLLPEQA